ncbi:MAG: UbiA family prenyltransferase [Candidatus Poribacteria bacterium]
MVLTAYIRLIRPLNGLIAFISVILGAFLSNGNINPINKIIFASSVALLLLSAGNALNDYCDVLTDKINKPSRPIPAGLIKKRSALIFSVILFLIAIGISYFVNLTGFIIALIAALLLILYSAKLRDFPLLANSIIAFLTGLAFIYGGVAVKSIKGAIIPAIFAFLFTLSREVVKDIQDIKGDQLAGMSSIPINWGKKKAIFISVIFSVLVIVGSPMPYIIGYYSVYYLICMIFGVDLVLVYCIASLLKDSSEKNSGKIATIMKFDIFACLVAIYFGR